MASSTTETKPFSVLFVCLGNICRSPAAEGVFRDLVKKRGLDSKFHIDSAGTINYHEGNPADSRMRAAASRRGIQITSTSRPIRPSDFRDFDLILAMDKSNRADMLEGLEALERWKKRQNLPPDADKKKSQTLTMAGNKALRRCWIFWKMPVSHCWTPFCLRLRAVALKAFFPLLKPQLHCNGRLGHLWDSSITLENICRAYILTTVNLQVDN